MSTAVDWSDLHRDLLQAIASALPNLQAYIRFRAVCRAWRFAARRNPPNHLLFPWLMLPTSTYSHPHRSTFRNPLTNTITSLTLPEATLSRRRAGSSHGWLVLIEDSPVIFLINPLSRRRITLPPLSSFPNVVNFDFYALGKEYTVLSPNNEVCYLSLKEMRDFYLKKVILSNCPRNSSSEFITFGIVNKFESLAYCKNGDDKWKIVDGVRGYSEDVIYLDGSFYAVNKFGSIAICDFSNDADDLVKVRFINVEQQIDGDMQYLVDGLGDLLLVSRYLEFEIDMEHYAEVCKTVKFRVFRMDWSTKKWVSVTSLEDKVLFLGGNSSVAIRASSYSGCEGNRIYFTDDYLGGNYDGPLGDHDVGIYNIKDGSVEPLPCYSTNSQWPIWITPTLI